MYEGACLLSVMLVEKFYERLTSEVVKNPRGKIDGSRMFQTKCVRHHESTRELLNFGQSLRLPDEGRVEVRADDLNRISQRFIGGEPPDYEACAATDINGADGPFDAHITSGIQERLGECGN